MFVRIIAFLGLVMSLNDAGASVNIKLQELSTPCGQKVWFLKNDHAPVFTIALSFRNAGSKREAPHKRGVVKLLSDMLVEGCNGDDPKTFKRFVIDANIELTINHDADDIAIILRTTKDKMCVALTLIGDMLTKPSFPVDEFKRSLQQFEATLAQMQHDPKTIGGETLICLTYGDHPYVANLTDVLKNLSSITIQDLKDHLKTYLTADNLVISVVGQVEEKELLQGLDALIKKLPAKAPVSDIQDITLKVLPDVKYVYMDIPQSIILFNHPGLHRHHKDYYAFYLMLTILGGGGFDSRLFQEVREKRGLAYYIGVDLRNMPHISVLSGVTACKTEAVDEVIHHIRSEFTKMKDQGVTAEELTHHRDYMIGIYAQAFTESTKIIGLMDAYQMDGIPSSYIQDRKKILKALTKEDLDAAAKTYLCSEKLSFVVVGRNKPKE